MADLYNTGNPLGSNNLKDLSDNTVHFDEGMNSTSPRFTDRLGNRRETWAGLKQMVSDYLVAQGYEPPLAYASGLVITRSSQTISYNGDTYRVKVNALPLTTTTWANDSSKMVLLVEGGLRTDLAGDGGAALVSYKRPETGAVQQNAQDFFVSFPMVTDFGAVLDGITDDGPAIRRALDAIPATGGGVQFPYGSVCKVVGTIFIPQRIGATDVDGRGVKIIGNNSTLIGDGTSNIFESGSGQFSTVSLGGKTNFGLTPESPQSLHYNSLISGFNFKNCADAIKLFNWTIGCRVADNTATKHSGRFLYAERCFYLDQEGLIGRPFDATRGATVPIFEYKDSNNSMKFNNLVASGVDPNGVRRGVGFKFDAGVQTIDFSNCSAEACVTGLQMLSYVYNMEISSVYFENNTTHIDASGAICPHLVIDNSWFDVGTTAITADNWLSGRLGDGNYYSATAGVVTFGSGCTHEVSLPVQPLGHTQQGNWLRLPAGWTVPAGCQVRRNDMIYNANVGFSGVWFRNNPDTSGNTGIVPMSYTGDCFNVPGIIPYCAVASPSTGVLTIDTKIAWNDNLSAVRFDLLIAHTQNDVIAGVLSANSTIFRDDALTTRTVAATNVGGFVRLTLGGFGAITNYSGKVRII